MDEAYLEYIEMAMNIVEQMGFSTGAGIKLVDGGQVYEYHKNGLERKREKFLFPSGVKGLYKPSEDACYVVAHSPIELIETLVHENAHAFLMKTTPVGNALISMDKEYESIRSGKSTGDSMSSSVFYLSQMVNEGFATWAGLTVMKSIAEGFENPDDIKSAYERVTEAIESLPILYRNGYILFRDISYIFGPATVPAAAQISMNVEYKTDGLDILVDVLDSVYARTSLKSTMEPPLDVLFPYGELMASIPNLRLISYAQLLPSAISSRGDILKENDVEWFLSSVRYYLREEFLGLVIDEKDMQYIKKSLTEDADVNEGSSESAETQSERSEKGSDFKTGIIIGDVINGNLDMLPLLKEHLGTELYYRAQELAKGNFSLLKDFLINTVSGPEMFLGIEASELGRTSPERTAEILRKIGTEDAIRLLKMMRDLPENIVNDRALEFKNRFIGGIE